VRQTRIERKAAIPQDRDRYAALPLDPRDADIVRAKILQRRTRPSYTSQGRTRERPKTFHLTNLAVPPMAPGNPRAYGPIRTTLVLDKGTPAARRGRKARGLARRDRPAAERMDVKIALSSVSLGRRLFLAVAGMMLPLLAVARSASSPFAPLATRSRTSARKPSTSSV